METMWLIVGVIALLAAVLALAATTWRLLGAERRRSEARVAALAALIDDPEWVPASPGPRDETTLNGIMLAPSRGLGPASRVFAFAAGGIVVVLSATALLWLGRADHRPATSSRASAPAAFSLELLSMRHAREGESLIVSGVVRNPSELPTRPLTVVVSALGRGGELVARGASRLDPVVLEPGKETSFRVTVTSSANLQRYRLGFVDGDHVIPHVDRRPDLTRSAMAID